MNCRFACLLFVGLLLLCSTAVAQPGSAVQLPTYSFFSTGTTVSVPDRGSVFLGGIKRAEMGRNEFGSPLLPFRNRSIGMSQSFASNRVSVYIHDFDAMDQHLLNQPTGLNQPAGLASERFSRPSRRFAWQGPVAPTFATPTATTLRLDRTIAKPPEPSQPTAMSLAELKTKHRLEQSVREDKAVELFQRGERAEAKGKRNVARIFYQMAAQQASDTFKPQVLARLKSVSQPETKLAVGR